MKKLLLPFVLLCALITSAQEFKNYGTPLNSGDKNFTAPMFNSLNQVSEYRKGYLNDRKIHSFSTPFDFSAVDFLEQFNVPAYKIASSEITDVNLIKYIGETGKPVIMSTGMANLAEIHEAVNALKRSNCKNCLIQS